MSRKTTLPRTSNIIVLTRQLRVKHEPKKQRLVPFWKQVLRTGGTVSRRTA